jgi:Ca2+-binding EF-hand superfamily protein
MPAPALSSSMKREKKSIVFSERRQIEATINPRPVSRRVARDDFPCLAEIFAVRSRIGRRPLHRSASDLLLNGGGGGATYSYYSTQYQPPPSLSGSRLPPIHGGARRHDGGRRSRRSAASDADRLNYLKDQLAAQYATARYVLEACDIDGSGGISRDEWRRVLPRMGLGMSEADADALFAEFDADGNGDIDFNELHDMLRAGRDIKLSSKLRAGAVDFDRAVSQKVATRKEARSSLGSNVLNGLELKADGDVLEQLRDAISANLGRITDLFKEWDVDGNGSVDRAEFELALRTLGLRVAPSDAASLFDSLDVDHSGLLDYSELRSRLRGHGAPQRVRMMRRPTSLPQLPSHKRKPAGGNQRVRTNMGLVAGGSPGGGAGGKY